MTSNIGAEEEEEEGRRGRPEASGGEGRGLSASFLSFVSVVSSGWKVSDTKTGGDAGGPGAGNLQGVESGKGVD